MKPTSKALGVLLLTVVTAGTIAAQVMPAMPAPHHQPARCHEHGPEQSSPLSPASTDYVCCQTGHHAALLRKPFTIRISGGQIALVTEATLPRITTFLCSHEEPHQVPSSSPPTLLALRI